MLSDLFFPRTNKRSRFDKFFSSYPNRQRKYPGKFQSNKRRPFIQLFKLPNNSGYYPNEYQLPNESAVYPNIYQPLNYSECYPNLNEYQLPPPSYYPIPRKINPIMKPKKYTGYQGYTPYNFQPGCSVCESQVSTFRPVYKRTV